MWFEIDETPRERAEKTSRKSVHLRTFAAFAFSLAIFSSCDRSEHEKARAPDPAERITLEDPDGAYTVEVPVAWGVVENPQKGPMGSVTYTRSPDLVVSLMPMPPDAPISKAEQMSMFFAMEKPVGEAVEEELEEGSAAHRIYMNEGDTHRWWIRVLRSRGYSITMTISDESDRFQQKSDDYLAAMKSLVMKTPEAAPDDSLPGEHTDEVVAEILTRTPGGFWGKAVTRDGDVIEPNEDETTDTALVTGEEARAIIAEAVDVGLAEWCGLAWKPIFFAAQDARREAGWDERKVAYAGLLFGASQAFMHNRARREFGVCGPSQRETIRQRVERREGTRRSE